MDEAQSPSVSVPSELAGGSTSNLGCLSWRRHVSASVGFWGTGAVGTVDGEHSGVVDLSVALYAFVILLNSCGMGTSVHPHSDRYIPVDSRNRLRLADCTFRALLSR